MANLIIGGVDLSAVYGLSCPDVSGMLNLQGVDTVSSTIAGRRKVVEIAIRRRLEPFTVDMVMTGVDRDTFLSKLASLKSLLSPDNGYQAITRVDFPSKRLMARCKGFPLNEDLLPFGLRGGKFQVTFEPLGPWEDTDLTEQTITGTTGNIALGGDFVVLPTYTCMVTASLPSGLDFTVGVKQFAWNGALVNGDVLVINCDTCIVTKNGAINYADVDGAALFPELVPGLNEVTKSSSNFNLKISYRCQYE